MSLFTLNPLTDGEEASVSINRFLTRQDKGVCLLASAINTRYGSEGVRKDSWETSLPVRG